MLNEQDARQVAEKVLDLDIYVITDVGDTSLAGSSTTTLVCTSRRATPGTRSQATRRCSLIEATDLSIQLALRGPWPSTCAGTWNATRSTANRGTRRQADHQFCSISLVPSSARERHECVRVGALR